MISAPQWAPQDPCQQPTCVLLSLPGLCLDCSGLPITKESRHCRSGSLPLGQRGGLFLSALCCLVVHIVLGIQKYAQLSPWCCVCVYHVYDLMFEQYLKCFPRSLFYKDIMRQVGTFPFVEEETEAHSVTCSWLCGYQTERQEQDVGLHTGALVLFCLLLSKCSLKCRFAMWISRQSKQVVPLQRYRV